MGNIFKRINNWLFHRLSLPPKGLILKKPEPNDAHDEEIFGSKDFGNTPSRDWRTFRPLHEIQAWGDCVSFSRNNCAEAKAKIKGITDDRGEEVNFSDLYLAVKSGTSQAGNSLRAVTEYFRKFGVVLERDCPYTRNWNERNAVVAATPPEAPRYLGGNWAWVIPTRNNLKNSLEESPIQIGVGLGETYQYNTAVISPPRTITVYHAMMCDYIDEKGQVYCYDHYNRKEVVLSADYPIEMAMSFKDLPENWRGMGVDEKIFYSRMVGKFIMRVKANGELYEVFEDKMVKIQFTISNQKIWDAVHATLRPMIVGVTEEDFERLSKVAFTMGGIVGEKKNINLSKYFN